MLEFTQVYKILENLSRFLVCDCFLMNFVLEYFSKKLKEIIS